MTETQDKCKDVLERLQRTQYQLDAMAEGNASPETTTALHQIGTRFHAFLSQHTKKPAFERLVSTRVIVGLLRGFHCEIDEVEAQLAPNEDGGDSGQPTWKEKWEAAEHAVEERLLLLANEAWKCVDEAVRHKSSYSAKSQQLLQSVTMRVARMSGAPVPAVPEWFIPDHEVQRGIRPFDRGSFGEIYRGTWRGLKVVVKCVTVTTEYEKRTFQREAKIWHKAKHANIVKFFGACHLSRPCFFVCEEAENGNLVDYLDRMDGADPSLVWRLLHEVALGLQFLPQEGIVHGDLKCNQVLVSGEGVAMLTDFGLSFISAESRPEASTGAVRWKAPECLSIEGLAPTFESDVYSFGMCIVETLTRNLPWGIYLPNAAVMDHLRHRTFLPRPAETESDEQW
ncbi:hypothetical protein BBJ28_00021288 [Nothophytophthora sp. Chile5]|nr:hypothetical protein BBJ28_00021288 [Nothophytophthora sp. Chile5]